MSEFARPLRLDALGPAPASRAIAATPPELAALARRFDLAHLDALEADLTAQRIAGGIALGGRVTARGAQTCVVSGLPVAFDLTEPVALRFEPPPHADADELELTDADLDTLPLEGDHLDLGEAAAQAMGLALDPYPKATASELADYRSLLVSEEEAARAANLFAVLREGNA